jgi:hypothetical protein
MKKEVKEESVMKKNITVYTYNEDESIETEYTVTCTISPYHPAVMYLRNGDPGYPEEGGELEKIDIFLNEKNITNDAKTNYSHNVWGMHYNKITRKYERIAETSSLYDILWNSVEENEETYQVEDGPDYDEDY